MQVGDRVIVHRQARSCDRDRLAIGTIVDETKTSWRVKYSDGFATFDKTLFRKSDLYLRNSDSFCCTRISPWSQEEWKAYEDDLLRRTAANNLSRFDWLKLDKDTLVHIHKLASEAKRKVKA